MNTYDKAILSDMKTYCESRGFLASYIYSPLSDVVRFTISKGTKYVTKEYVLGEHIRYVYTGDFVKAFCDSMMTKFEMKYANPIVAHTYHHDISRLLGYPTEVHPLADGLRAKVTLIDEMHDVEPWPKKNPNLKSAPNNLDIEKVIFNNPATIVLWKDGTKTIVKAKNEEFDPEKGLAMAITKKALGNKGNYFDTIKKWTREGTK